MKNPLRPRTPIEMLAPGVDPSLNRDPPASVNFRRLMFFGALLMLIVCGAVTFLMAQASAGRSASAEADVSPITEEPTLIQVIEATAVPTDTLQPTHTEPPTATPTLDDWSITGTALFFATSTATFTWTPTLDYCWWLTPSPTPSVTPNQPTPTLDDWQVHGTQVFIDAHTLTPTMPPTQRPPRALCDGASTPIPPTQEAQPTHDGPFPTLDLVILPPATWTPVPVQQDAAPVYQPPAQQQVVITSPPQVIYVTSAPIDSPPVLIVVTATRLPATSTFTASPTLTPTNTATSTPTATNTASPTWTPTTTPSLTASPSPTWTPSPTATLVPPTATFTATIPPTAYPQLQIVGASCDGGHLTYTIQNTGGSLLEQLQYRLIDQFLLVNSTGLFGGIPSGQMVTVDLGMPVPGLWILGFDYLGQTVYSNQVTCASPTATIEPPTMEPPTAEPTTEETVMP